MCIVIMFVSAVALCAFSLGWARSVAGYPFDRRDLTLVMITASWEPQRVANFHHAHDVMRALSVELDRYNATHFDDIGIDEMIWFEREGMVSFTHDTFGVDSKGGVVRVGNRENVGTLGCAVSHLNIVQDFSKTCHRDLLVVFEDDATIEELSARRLMHVVASVPPGFFIVNLSMEMPVWFRPFAAFLPEIYRTVGKFTMTQGTIISCEGARAIVDAFPATEAIDLFYRKLVQEDVGFRRRVYSVNPPVLSSRNFPSSRA